MNTSFIKIVFILVCCLNLLPADSSSVKKKVLEIKKTEFGKRFLERNSEIKLMKIMLFLENPIKKFNSIKNIKNICSYISIYEDYSYKSLNDQSVFTIFLKSNFQNINDKKAEILTFLLSTCNSPVYLEELADIYSKLFKSYHRFFLKPLEKKDWKKIVDRLDSGNWDEFKKGLEKLGDTPFENKVKEYVFAPRDEKGNRIQN